MNILKVIPVFAPAWQAGGSVHVAYSLACELVKRKHNVYVYTTNFLDTENNFSFSKREYLLKGIHVTYFKNYLRWNGVLFSPYMIRSFMNDFRQFDVVHLHTYRGFQDVVAFLSKTVGIPYILQAHGSLHRIEKEKLKLIYDTFFGRKILKNASKVIALSRVEAEQYKRMGVPEEKIAIIPNGIDLSEYAELPPKGSFKKKFNIPEDRKIILYLGRIHKTKGIDFLVKAYAHLIKETNFKDAVLVIAGPDDGYLSEVKSLMHDLSVSNYVLFTGLLSEKDKIKAYTDASIVAYLGPFEPYGLVSLEAAACETPVIVAQGTPMAEIVNRGKFGFSVNYGDIASLSKRMYELICDDVLREELGRRGRDFVFKNFSWSNIVTKIEKVYEEILRD